MNPTNRTTTPTGLIVSFLLVTVLGGIVMAGMALPAIVMAQTTTSLSLQAFEELPSELAPGPLPEKSTILAADGSLLATFYDQNRVVVPLTEISEHLQHAVISVEDSRFYDHNGVDVRGTGRALVLGLVGADQQGGSTITQQYVKNVLIEKALEEDSIADQNSAMEAATTADGIDGIARKMREAKLAIALEEREEKDKILEGYLNIAQFGASVYGAESAANHYFSKSASDLTYLEAATIAGITQNPTFWDPTRNPEESQGRRDVVLMVMYQQGYITEDEYNTGLETPLSETLQVSPIVQGCQTADAVVAGSGYFCDFVTKIILTDPVFGETRQDRQELLYQGGLTITTTLDPRVQQLADQEVKASVPVADPSGEVQVMSVVEPGTGQVKAMAQSTTYVPNAAESAGESAINLNVGYPYYSANRGFQPGSTFKAFTLLSWLEAGHSLGDVVNGGKPKFNYRDFDADCIGGLGSGTFTVANSEGSGSMMSVGDATRNSVNRAFMSMAEKLDLCTIMQNAADLGVVRAKTGENIQPLPMSVLGTDNTTPLAMAGAFAAFASGGVYCTPIAIMSISNGDGDQIPVPDADCHQEIERPIANAMNYALSKVWTGTMKSVGYPGFPAAGKTGTSNRNEYTWFVGYTPRLAAAVAVANPTGAVCPNYQTIGNRYYRVIYGSDIAGPTWKRFMTKALAEGENPGFGSTTNDLIYGKQISVPDVVGMTVSDATSALQAAGFTVEVASTPVDSNVPAGRVASQSARTAAVGSEITLTLSNGNTSDDHSGGGNGGWTPGGPGGGGH